ncbi:cytochrome P450 [Nocardia blacklockiae]|uniref:cytochrome P450 n=1 Tax=Nocardia blacklockiae TaxID=480036 RepID=UPI001895AEF1|nr:cytochrome P450 [Nocardia blacklockiae]MBF6172175.1 cytochrome P450 [Nocardia blacklockiae]
MHIAMFTDFHPATVGGIQTSVNSQRRALQRLGHRVTLFTTPGPELTDTGVRFTAARPDGDAEVRVLSGLAGVRVNGYPMVIPSEINNRFIDAVFAAGDPVDVVHVHTTYGVGILGVRAARRHGLPLVQSVHSRDDAFLEHTSPVPYLSAVALRGLHALFLRDPGRLPRNAESRAARHAWSALIGHARAADAVVVPSHHFAERVRAHGLNRPIHVVSNGVDDELLENLLGPESSDSDRVRARDSEANGAPAQDVPPLRVLWCGRLSAEKRPVAAVEAVVRAPGCTLDIYGGGDEYEKVRAAAAATDRIRLHGEVSQADCLAAMRDHDVLLFPSSGFDTQGMALLEAIAVGLPVVYCDHDLTETIPDGGGVRTRDASPAAIAETLRELAADRPRLAALREKIATGADAVRQSRQTGHLLAVYDAVTDPSVRATPVAKGVAPLNVPTAPGALPLLGHSLHALRDALGFVTSLSGRGPVVRIRLGPRPAYVLTTPELIRQVAFGEAGEFHREELRDAVRDIIHEASNVLSGKPHELRRRLVAPALRQRRLLEYARVATDIAEDWARSHRPGPVDLMDEAHRLVLDTVSATLFTADFGADAKDEIREHIPWLLGQVIQRAALPAPVRRMRLIADRRFRTRAARLRAEIGAVVTEYRRRDHDFHDVLSALVRHVDPETGVRLSDEQIIDELLLMLAAGVGSTASMLGWLWHELMRHPDVAARVREELDTVVGTGPVRPEHAAELPFLRLTLQETLRLWAPWVSTHTAASEVRLGAVTLPPGSMVVFSPYMIHHDPRWFPDPETFDPDRWAPGRVESIDRSAVLPFAVGPRHCPGSNFAMLTITLQTAALLTRWETIPDPDYRVRPSNRDFVVAPTRLPVTLRPRGAQDSS